MSDSDRDLIKSWIVQGAADDSGRATLSPEVGRDWVGTNETIQSRLEPTFEDTFYRFIQGHDFYRVLDQFFGHSFFYEPKCQQLNDSNFNVLGGKSPVNGQPISRTASLNYLQLVQDCAIRAYKSFMSNDRGETSSTFTPYPSNLKVKHQDTEIAAMDWTTLSTEDQLEILRFLHEQLVGLGIYNDEILNAKLQNLLNAINQHIRSVQNAGRAIDVDTASMWAATLIVASPDFLTY